MSAARKHRAHIDHEARRVTHLAHVNMRLRTMYGMEVDGADFDAMARTFRSGKVATSKPDNYGRVWGWVDVGGTLVCACYSPTARCVTTVMPPPPPMPGAKPAPVVVKCGHTPEHMNEVAKAHAATMVQQQYGDSATRRADVAWLKARMNDVKRLIRMGEPFAAHLLADAVCSLPGSAHPSMDPAASEAALQQRAAREVEDFMVRVLGGGAT